MACFLVPAAEAVITTIAAKAIKSKEKDSETVKVQLDGSNPEAAEKIPFSRKLKWLNNLLWGGSALLAFEHVWHGEVVPWFPFLTAAGDPVDVAEMLQEIPAGTRVTNGNGLYFQTEKYAEIPTGSEYVDVESVCTIQGVQGNGLLPGQIDVLTDPLPYIQSVANIKESEGGAELESDESLAERTYLAPSSYSVAGPEDAFSYWAKTYNANIGSVKPTTPEPGVAVIYVLMKDGTMPGQEILDGLTEYLQDEQIRPMTDRVTAAAPYAVDFSINLQYYINQSDQAQAAKIQSEVETAVQEYISWQTTAIGRDINPDELRRLIKTAGAKRIIITSPEFTVIPETSVAQLSEMTVEYGGLEDD